jgi:hypothetical protein
MSNISSGTAGDLLAYMDSLTQTTEAPWPSVLKSAARQVFLIVDGDDFAERDVMTLDIDEYLGRFEDVARADGRYAPRSLRAYQSRFRRAVGHYRSHLADPHWEPPLSLVEQRARTPVATAGSSRESSRHRDTPPTGKARSQPSSPRDSSAPFVTYPFPLRSGEIARLHLPPQLDPGDAERLTAFIRALVVQEARAGQQGEVD